MRPRYALTCILLLVIPSLVTAQVFTDRPRIAVLPLVNLTEQDQNEIVASVTTNTMILTLRLLGSYTVVEVPPDLRPDSLFEATLAEKESLAEDLGVENILYGNVVADDAGVLLFRLEVYDRAAGAVTVAVQSEAPSVFDVFDAADQLVEEAVEGFSGIRIGFGSLRFSPDDPELPFIVRVDGTDLGESPTTIGRVLIGERGVEILQERGGRFAIIHSETVMLEEGETREIVFRFPQVTPEEGAREAELRERIEELLIVGVEVTAVQEGLSELGVLYARLPGVFFPGEAALPWYERRLAAMRELHELARLNAVELLRRPEEERAAAGAAFAGVWESQLAGLSPVPAEPWEERQRAALRFELRRNITAFGELVLLARTAVANPRDVELIPVANEWYAPLNTMQNSLYSVQPETEISNRYATEYERAYASRRRLWHWIPAVIGLGAVGASAYADLVLIPDAEKELDKRAKRYDEAQEFDTAARERKRVDDQIDELDDLQTYRNAGYIGGGVMISVSALVRATRLRRPARVWREYRNELLVTRRLEASLNYEERRWEDGESMVLIIGRNEMFSTGAGAERLLSPQLLPATPGSAWEVEHINAGFGRQSEYRFTVQPGLNILFLGGRE